MVQLLTETTLDVVVFTGNLDLICDTPGNAFVCGHMGKSKSESGLNLPQNTNESIVVIGPIGVLYSLSTEVGKWKNEGKLYYISTYSTISVIIISMKNVCCSRNK